MQLQTTLPESKFPNEYSENRFDFHSNRSTFEKVIAKIQRGPDFMKHSVEARCRHDIWGRLFAKFLHPLLEHQMVN